MRYLSVCSGIEAASVAWQPLGWQAAAFSEIEPFCCALLAHHYPEVPNLGDMTRYDEWTLGPIDLLVGGTPCQSFSVAGLRGGMADARGNLSLVFMRLVARFLPRWVVWENVPGVLSSNGGRDFGAILGALAELGYGFAYRVLDAQYFGVPQRRRRVFVVGHSGDWRSAAAVLFERESLRGDSAPSREAGTDVARCLARGPCGSHGRYDPNGETYVTAYRTSGNSGVTTQGNRTAALNCATDPTQQIIAYTMFGGGKRQDRPEGGLYVTADDTMKTLESSGLDPNLSQGGAVVHFPSGVRRLTPRECERLQGFPDDYTAIPYRGKPAAEGPRYRALGNSMAVHVVCWIGERIAAVDDHPP